eukprot:TRINITY_DN70746_c0_g1_i1.p3 TRINITY_DN70746_c0_g1~~TRINITY_DN70746_c0_g1_i1.p3  ORF type:complete len:102 (-),score=24.36 TRINITY_DN70746_c0_g1_i1:38-343(-)
MDECRALQEQAQEAASEGEWRRSAELYTGLVNRLKSKLAEKSGSKTATGPEAILALTSALSGRARAWAEMGRPRGKLAANSEILNQAQVDAFAAANLESRL